MSRREIFTASGFGPPAKPKGDHLTPEERAEVERRIAEGKVTRVERGVQATADMDRSIEARRDRGRRIAQREMKFRRLRQSAETLEAASREPGPSAAAIERMRRTDEELTAERQRLRRRTINGISERSGLALRDHAHPAPVGGPSKVGAEPAAPQRQAGAVAAETCGAASATSTPPDSPQAKDSTPALRIVKSAFVWWICTTAGERVKGPYGCRRIAEADLAELRGV